MAISPMAHNDGIALDGASVRDLIAFIHPRPDVLRWRAIPWQTDLQEASRLAADDLRPDHFSGAKFRFPTASAVLRKKPAAANRAIQPEGCQQAAARRKPER